MRYEFAVSAQTEHELTLQICQGGHHEEQTVRVFGGWPLDGGLSSASYFNWTSMRLL